MRRFFPSRPGLRSCARPALVALGLFLAFSSAAQATDYVVTKTTDSSDGLCDADCSLREAIIAANGNAGADRIVLGSGLVYTLSLGPADAPAVQAPAAGDLDITDALTIDGNGSTVDAGGLDRVFDIRGPFAVSVSNLTITNGNAAGFLSLGGGLYIGSGASVTLQASAITASRTAVEGGVRDNGGGIAVVGMFNAATGVTTRSSLTLIGSNVSGNTGASGGGIVCVLCSLTSLGSGVSGNTADGTDGGGMVSVGDGSILSITSSTLAGNTVSGGAGRGGGLSVPFGSGASVVSRTRIVSNSASTGSAIFASTAAVTATNNWWGCNAGPGAATPGCSAAPNATSGAITTSPFLILRIGAAPATVVAGASSTVTADLTFNSSSADTSSGGTLPNGISSAFIGTLGTFAAPTVTTTSGRAASLFTAGGVVGAASVSTVVDAQSVSTTIAIGVGSSTTIQASPDSIAAVTEAVVLTATVVSVPAGTTPGGTVAFKDGGTTITGCGSVAVSGGVATCTIPPNTYGPGVHSFTAEYSGGGGISPSVSGSLGYVYVQCHTSAACPGIITTGVSGPGSPLVRRFTYHTRRPIDGPTSQFSAFASSFTGGVRVAEADVTGDGAADVIAGTGPGVEARVIVFNGVTGAVVRDFLPGFAGTGGVFVAAGDVDGDGMPDIIVGDGSGSTEVRVFSGASGVPVWSLTLGDPAFAGGVRVAAGDIDGDGYADLVVASGPGAESKARVFGGASRAELRTFSPYGSFTGGVFVAVGDVNGDGFSDIVTGADAGGGPHVRVFNGATGVEIYGFFATDPAFTGGVRVAAGDLDGDGKADIVTSFGTGSDLVLVFNAASGFGGDNVPPLIQPPAPGGLFVSTAVPANRMVIDAPATAATVPNSFRLNGWAYEQQAPGTGVDVIHVWAYPVSGAAPFFLGAATLERFAPRRRRDFRYSLRDVWLSPRRVRAGRRDLRPRRVRASQWQRRLQYAPRGARARGVARR